MDASRAGALSLSSCGGTASTVIVRALALDPFSRHVPCGRHEIWGTLADVQMEEGTAG